MRTVLMVEDEMHLAMMMQDILEDAGYHVLKAGRLPLALELANTQACDAAVLDINIAGNEVFPLAAELRRRGVPILFTSGYGVSGLPGPYRDCPMLQKPYRPEQLTQAIEALLPRVDGHG